jgi:hypothetical protein
MMAGWFEILIVLVVLGVGAAIVTAIVAALSSNKQGAALVLGGLVVLGLLLGAGLMFAMVGYRVIGLGDATPFVGFGPGMMMPPEDGHHVHTTWNFSLGGVFLAAAIIAILAFGARKHAAVAHAAAGHRRLWPFLLIPLAALFFLGTVRVQSKRTNYPPPPVAVNTYPHTQRAAVHQQGRIVASVEAMQRSVQNQQEQLERNVAQSQVDVEKRIAKMDIHALMDKVDEPRIALQSDAADDKEAPDSSPAPSAETAESDENGEKVEVKSSEETSKKRAGKSGEDSRTKKGGAGQQSQDTKSKVESGNETTPAATEAGLPTTKEITEELVAKVTRPVWVDAPPKRIGEKTAKEVLVTDEWSSEEECERARDIGLMLKTYEHLQRLIGAPYHGFQLDHRMNSDASWGDDRLRKLARMGITVDYARREIAKDEFLETVDRSVGPMMKLYTLVEFSPDVDRELRQRWDAYQRQENFAIVGGGAASILGLLGLIFGLLKIDTWTKGYYTKRLFLGVPAAIIGGALLFAVLATL